MQGSAAFFAPLTRTVPSSGSPPRITNLSMKSPCRHIVAGNTEEIVDGKGTGAGDEHRVAALLLFCDLVFCDLNRPAHVALGCLQSGGSHRPGDASSQHYEGNRGAISTGFEGTTGGVV